MQYINRLEKEMTLTRRLKIWNCKFLKKLNNFDWYILVKLLNKMSKKKENAILKTHQKKIRNLTNNSTNPFTHKEVKKHLSSKHLTNKELGLLRFGLPYYLPPSRVYKTNVFVLFEMMHHFSLENLKNEIGKPKIKSEISHLANSCGHNYKSSLKKVKNDRSIVILQPEKRNAVVVLDRF